MRMMQRSTPWLFGVLTAAGLTFGAASVFAAPRSVCENLWGTCSSQSECESRCVKAGGESGYCRPEGCCICAF